MSIVRIGVVGAGQMGNGIAQVAAAAGYDVTCTDVSEAALERGRKTIEGSLARVVKKEIEKTGAAKTDVAAILGRIRWSTDVIVHADADLVIEAATENPELKFKIFEQISKIAKPDAILATNTSSISITAIAARTDRPHKVMGMHFMNPVPLMQLVELIRGIATDDATYAAVKDASEKMGKTTVVGRDMPGFIVNRVLMPYINEAVQALYEGIGSVEDIDTAMKLGTNVTMGPLTLADFIGLDTCLAILKVLHEGMGDSKYRPSPLLVKYVEAGWLGRKSGRGFYTYPGK
jgi:3-hydroxybutyryl-CoA dehydrogenase